MENLNKYGLLTVKDIPKWIARIPFFRRLWFNPVFQRNYRNSRVRKLIEPKTAFRVGLIWSLLFSVTMTIISIVDHYASFVDTFLGFIIAPFAVIYVWTFIRMFFFCLITTPRELQQDISRDNQGIILTTPISDASLFFAEILPNLVRGLEVAQSVLYLFIGTAIPAIVALILVKSFCSNHINYGWDQTLIYAILTVIIMFIALFLMMLLTSVETGTFAISHSIISAIVSSIFYSYIVLNLAAGGIGLAILLVDELTNYYSDWLYYSGSPHFWQDIREIILVLLPILSGTFVILWACLFTSHIGISALAKVRRSGFYKPESSNAAGLE
ncbi:MAG: hypothetical protein NTY09_15470 [bacterium]|nr:hypothetical protein [bacterium]